MTQPIAFSVAMLAWGLLAFPQSYTAAARAQTLQQIQVRASSGRQNCQSTGKVSMPTCKGAPSLG